ncbi:MAG TPA: DEAD/DEAH box helicase [Propionibacteriaceae bacterium]|nr:DEAD/DEAH box helicase [Propionibacteriaceae bacterium]
MSAETWSALLANEAIIAMVGREAFARALIYARSGRVSDLQFDEQALTVTGRVSGSYRDAYATTVRLANPDGHRPGQHSARCSCPVVQDCKHAAAVLIAARGQSDIVAQLERPPWEKTLTRLVNAPDPAFVAAVTPLALEFEVQEIPAYRGYPGRRELRARPVKQGRSGKWVRSGISWDDLDFFSRLHPEEHRDLLLQIRAATGPTARYNYPRSPWIALSSVTSGIWSLLRIAERVGLVLVGLDGQSTPAVLAEPAAVTLDLRRSLGALVLEPRITVAGQALDLSAVGLLGDPAHGLFSYTPGRGTAPHGELSLIRFAEPLSRELRQLVIERQTLTIPESDEHRLLHDYYPQLRSKAALASSDASVSLPELGPPVLTLRCTFRPEQRLRLDWGWSYAVGEDRVSFSLDEPVRRPTLRDAGEEAVRLLALPLPYDRLPQLADTGAARRGLQPAQGPAPSALLADLQVLHFCEEVLPELEAAGVEVSVVGERPDYRRVDGAPLVELSTVERDETSDWFDLRIQVSLEGEVIPFDTLFVALTRGDEYLVLDTGVYLTLDRPEFTRLRDLIKEARALQEPDSEGLRISRFQAGFWEELLQLGVVVEQSDRWAKAVSGLVNVDGVDAVEVPETLHAELRPYQVDGFRWLAFLWSHGLGGILADDMGLGKTLQALALICRARIQEPDGPPFLVVAPTSVTSNWAREIARFAPDLRVATVAESQAKRRKPLTELTRGVDVVITSYTLLRLDFDSFDGLAWTGLFLDEAQFVKNHRAKTYQCARRLSAPFKLAITGTPLENSLMDLWALLSITAPGLFPHPERFAEFYRRPIERSTDVALLAQLRRRIRPVMLRRTKDLVATELPPKQEQVIDVVLQPRHQRIYQTHLQRERQKILGLIDDLDSNRFTILSSLTLLRQLSLDASLVDEAYAGVASSKIDVLVEHLDELLAEGHRALVFSQFTGFLRRVRDRLDAHHIGYSYLDGSTRDRGRVVEEFRQGDTHVFLISLKAGGFGLNLTEADYCFLLDPWWNPAAEAQAVDRTHRIGQHKTVMVYRLVAQGTIEEKVMELKARKTELFNSVLSDDALAQATLSADEIRELLGG